MAIYLKLTPDVKGEATSEKAKDYIVLQSFQTGVGVGVATITGSGNRETGLPSFGEIVVTKGTDIASTVIFESVCTRKNYDKAEIIFTTMTGAGEEDVYLKYELENVIISGFSISSGGDRPMPDAARRSEGFGPRKHARATGSETTVWSSVRLETSSDIERASTCRLSKIASAPSRNSSIRARLRSRPY